MKKFDTQVQYLKYKVLREVARKAREADKKAKEAEKAVKDAEKEVARILDEAKKQDVVFIKKEQLLKKE